MNKTKKSIFNSSIEVFSKSGYRGATMDEIATTAGLAKGTLYYNFNSKEEIFNFIVDNGLKLLNDEIVAVNELNDDAIEKLKQVCKIQLTFMYEHNSFFRVVMSQLWGDEERQVILREKVKGHIKEIEKYIQMGIEDGCIRKGDSEVMAYEFFGTLCSSAIYELINIENVSLEDTINKTLEFIFNGLINKEA
ncbi:TetR/AcrR family transcriptional regulator [Clostridium botulinum]|uniref:TetR/AcrR family transcriptional regulator n=1 Tax=Clostridium botulinum TaxID=1491 RepID=A0A6B4JPU1_CLOBO|nr:TetR/AcrR family transcriptional regulator [Clostridium botulinum]EES50510.1 transcriptional regulator, TetR family [Clostridium botulinum E1 str. 'BoNT E Beluga']MBY6762409.1 TetR/AcrR family transcriptional regulator [Clostridium botulinum]MBY6921251.1 TetR/AcrR family transcriptional regulator [Clostridium botulinum]MCR1131890.1 TetR/AcrR family transcriptional regulator [Clostridium botulinum]NFJ58910.1 TetR/AcrR family transcriptional regulator [Clostridium botulinum]